MNSGYLKENLPFSLHISIYSPLLGNPEHPCDSELAEKSKTFGISK